MAKVVEEIPGAQPFPDDWYNGKVWELEAGTDYTVGRKPTEDGYDAELTSVLSKLAERWRTSAVAKGVRGRTHRKNGTIYLWTEPLPAVAPSDPSATFDDSDGS